MTDEPNRPCPKCRDVGRDKTGDHLWLMEDGKTWTCDKTEVHQQYFEKDGVARDTELQIAHQKAAEFFGVTDPFTLSSAAIRGIPSDTVDKFQVKVEFDTSTGDHKKYYFPVTQDKKHQTWKYKDLTVAKGMPNHFGRLASGATDSDLFGMHSYHLTPETIVITEGELDAMAAYHMLGKTVNKLHCLSLLDGANAKDLSRARVKNYLDKATHIVMCPDQDDAGQKILAYAASLFPKLKVMSFSEKDACDMLKEGKETEFKDAFVNAEKYKPNCIVTSKDVKKDAMKPVVWGLDYPFDGLTRFTFGLRTRRIIGIGAGPGAGKSVFIKAIQKQIALDHRIPIGVFGLEEDPADQQRELAGFVMNKPLHLPTCTYNDQVLSNTIDSFDKLVYFYDRQRYTDWQDIADAMMYMTSLGVKYIFIDPLSALVAHLTASDANNYLNAAMFDMSLLVQKQDITIFHVNHLNNPSTGKDHGAGGKVYASQFSGSRAMWKYSTDIWGLERNQYADTVAEKNLSTVTSLKYRKPSQSGSFQMTYNDSTGTLTEVVPKGGF